MPRGRRRSPAPGRGSPPLSRGAEGCRARHGDAGRTRLPPAAAEKPPRRLRAGPGSGQEAGGRRKVGPGAEAAERGAEGAEAGRDGVG